ncbi:MAG: RelA/SpoT domain protein [Clostridia bacterium]|nr:RelA/SpoT domain protein [Clostridia bacterium]MBR5923348.1 RelA/SpoT domain protein [Clostridia bacterium]
MTFEEFYREDYAKLKAARATLEAIAEEMKNGGVSGEDLQPIVYYCSRIKRPDSMKRKLALRGFPTTLESALTNVYDAVGIRIICSFASDVLSIVEKLENEPDIEIIEKKDYLLHPKPNGYRSIHLCVRLKEYGIPAEIQIRTIAMDFWATLEHQLKYKKNISDENLIKSELKRCADEIASVDLSMQTIREIIKTV